MRMNSTMKATRRTTFLVVTIMLGAAQANPFPQKKSGGPLTGTWECMSHGSAQGDLAFTLYLEHNKEIVTGSISSPLGSGEVTSGSLKDKFMELQIETPNGIYVVLGKLEKGGMTGTWSLNNGEKGTWEGKRVSTST